MRCLYGGGIPHRDLARCLVWFRGDARQPSASQSSRELAVGALKVHVEGALKAQPIHGCHNFFGSSQKLEPIRAFSAETGCFVRFDPATRTITAFSDDGLKPLQSQECPPRVSMLILPCPNSFPQRRLLCCRTFSALLSSRLGDNRRTLEWRPAYHAGSSPRCQIIP